MVPMVSEQELVSMELTWDLALVVELVLVLALTIVPWNLS